MKNTRRTLLASAAAAGAASAKTSKRQVHHRAAKPTGTPLYSEIISYGELVFVSGHGVNNVQGIQAQTKGVLDEIQKCLETAGSSMNKVLKCNVYLAKLEDYAAMNEVYRGRFGAEPPVRTTVAVAGIPLDGCLVEIECIAHK